jgi:HEAT repeats
MQCEEVREQFADYVISRTAAPVPAAISEHLAICDACRAEFEELTGVWEELGNVPPAAPPRGLRTQFNRMLDTYSRQFERPRPTWRRPLLEAAAIAATLVLGIAAGYRMHTTAPANQELSDLRSELSQTRQMVALSLMQQQSATDRLKGINWSYRLQDPGNDVLKALLDTLMHDANVNVRLATVDALRQFGGQPAVRRGVVEAMARQESPMVQIALIDLAVDLHEKESIQTLKQFAEDSSLDQSVRERAQKGLQELE